VTIYFFSRLLHVLKWGLVYSERRGLTTTGHSPSTGHSLTDWSSPPHIYTNSLKPEVQPSNIYRSSSYLTGNTLHIHYKGQPVNTHPLGSPLTYPFDSLTSLFFSNAFLTDHTEPVSPYSDSTDFYSGVPSSILDHDSENLTKHLLWFSKYLRAISRMILTNRSRSTIFQNFFSPHWTLLNLCTRYNVI
jgi:hypothetical protein